MSIQVTALDNQSLLNRTRELVSEERRITTEILKLLQEVQNRCLYSTQGYSSMHEFATKYLGYSDSAAQRRLAAMKLMDELPEIEEKLHAGNMNLSHLEKAQRFFKSEEKHANPLSLDRKREILQSIEGKSVRESEKQLISISSQPKKIQLPDRVKPVSNSQVEVRFVADESLLKLLDQVKEALGIENNPNSSMAELVTQMAKLALEKAQVSKQKAMMPRQEAPTSEDIPQELDVETANLILSKKEKEIHSKNIPVDLKRMVFKRDKGRCSYMDERSGKRCVSKHGLRYAQIVSPAEEGGVPVDRVSLVCKQHNLLLAIRDYGLEKISPFLRSDFRSIPVPVEAG